MRTRLSETSLAPRYCVQYKVYLLIRSSLYVERLCSAVLSSQVSSSNARISVLRIKRMGLQLSVIQGFPSLLIANTRRRSRVKSICCCFLWNRKHLVSGDGSVDDPGLQEDGSTLSWYLNLVLFIISAHYRLWLLGQFSRPVCTLIARKQYCLLFPSNECSLLEIPELGRAASRALPCGAHHRSTLETSRLKAKQASDLTGGWVGESGCAADRPQKFDRLGPGRWNGRKLVQQKLIRQKHANDH